MNYSEKVKTFFWLKQRRIKAYKKNKIYYNVLSAGFTGWIGSILYGLYYQNHIRRFPFSIQILTMLMLYKLNLNLMLRYKVTLDEMQDQIKLDIKN
jgi:hypothetical protein